MSPNQPDPLHLKPGSMVEVASDDEGFQGSRFVGKVIECLRDESSIQYVIEYETIFEDEAGKNPLRETLDISLLRPPQPEEKKKERVFQVGQVVDVYENDGWWEGSVIEVLEERKYSVYFEQTSEQHVYGGESLRVHREWVNGDWKPPVEDCVGSVIIKEKVNSNEENSAETKEQEKVNMGKENDGKAEEQEKLVLPCARKRAAVSPKQPDTSHLKPGSAVEISSDDTGFRGSWFIGTIIRCLCKKKPAKFLVEYKTLFEDEEGKKPLRETLHQYQLRPVQPTEKRPRKFKFADEVDAYFNDGWWEGDITGELGGERFNVYFRPAKEQLEFGEESLRIHREWTDGAWDPPIEDEDEGTEGKEEYKKVD